MEIIDERLLEKGKRDIVMRLNDKGFSIHTKPKGKSFWTNETRIIIDASTIEDSREFKIHSVVGDINELGVFKLKDDE
ncbi:MAG: hypothetical protein R3321_02385 [Nitrososphaeraceae archaeon]|nr:hypothetical protein [Nitrososphaeraceae archaeon]